MYNDGNGGAGIGDFRLANLTGTPGMVLVVFLLLLSFLVGMRFVFTGHVVL